MHNEANELTSIDATNLSYDDNGNLQNDGVYTCAYDEENRLTRVTRNSDSAVVGQYQYDALGRRVQKIADPAGVPSITRYFHDGARIIEEQDTLGVTQATYTYGNYIDEVLTMDRGGQTFYYHQNSLWSAGAITDAAGSVVERYAYDAYGLPAMFNGAGTSIPPNPWGTQHSAIGNPWMFTGRQDDEETGLYFYRARYYDALKGRFLQRDSLDYVDGMNLYAYVGNNAINRIDPMGLDVEEDLEDASAGAAAGAGAAVGTLLGGPRGGIAGSAYGGAAYRSFSRLCAGCERGTGYFARRCNYFRSKQEQEDAAAREIQRQREIKEQAAKDAESKKEHENSAEYKEYLKKTQDEAARRERLRQREERGREEAERTREEEAQKEVQEEAARQERLRQRWAKDAPPIYPRR